MREASRVLAPGGRFIFSVPNERFTDTLFTVGWLKRIGLARLAERFGRWWNANAAHYNLDSPEVWRARLARYGLTIEWQTPYMSAAAMRTMELTHYYGVPSIAWRKLTGRWTLRPGPCAPSWRTAGYCPTWAAVAGRRALRFYVACK